MALKEQNKQKEALTHFAKASEVWPRDWQTHMTLYNIYNELKLEDKAKAEEEILMKIQEEYQQRQEASRKAQEEAEKAAKEAAEKDKEAEKPKEDKK